MAKTDPQKLGARLQPSGHIQIDELVRRLMRADPNTGETVRIEWIPGVYFWMTITELRSALIGRSRNGFTETGVTIRQLENGNIEIAK